MARYVDGLQWVIGVLAAILVALRAIAALLDYLCACARDS